MKIATTLLVAAGLSGAALAQLYSQPWSAPLPSHESRVRWCKTPTVSNQVCFDDFRVTVAGAGVFTMNRIDWWGTLSSPNMWQRPVYIAIYRNTPGACKPDTTAPIWRICLKPKDFSFQGNDCTGRQVFRFFGILPAPVTLPANTNLWIQISEDDRQSWRFGLQDFGWSEARPLRNCPAMTLSGAGAFGPIVNPCDGASADLAFAIYP